MNSVAVRSDVDPDRCPWCGSLISRARSIEIETRIAEQERKKLADERSRMRKEFDAREAAIRQEAAAQAEARVKAEAEEKLTRLIAERQRDALKIKQLEEARAASAKDLALQLEAAKEQYGKDLDQARGALTQDRDDQLRKFRSEQNREREQLQQKIDGLTRQLSRKTSAELGEGAEIDVHECLRDAFPYDQVTRIKKGIPGADIRHEVLYKGVSCGVIVIDSKNRQGWQDGYVAKLREDQVAAKADYAILATTVFPARKKELCVDEETKVIIVSRERVAEIVALLRAAIVRMHVLGLSLNQRAEKRDQLYRYITSEEYRQRLTEADRLTNEVLDLEVEEKRAHDQVWEKRGKMVTRLKNVIRQVDTEISAVLEGQGPAGFKS